MENSADALQTLKGENAACPSSRTWSETLSSAAHTMYEDVKAVAANPIAQDVAGVAVVAGAMYFSRGRALEETAGKLLPEASSVMEGLNSGFAAADKGLVAKGMSTGARAVSANGKELLVPLKNSNPLDPAGTVPGIEKYLVRDINGVEKAAAIAGKNLGAAGAGAEAAAAAGAGKAPAAGMEAATKALREKGLPIGHESAASSGVIRGVEKYAAALKEAAVNRSLLADPFRSIGQSSIAKGSRVGALPELRPTVIQGIKSFY
jgi:hypothetical protein